MVIFFGKIVHFGIFCVKCWKSYTSKPISHLTPYSLFYQAGSGPRLSKQKLLQYLLEGTAAATSGEVIGDEEKDAVEDFKLNKSMLLLKFILSFVAIDFWFLCLYDFISLI
jgi:hypothetical protein